MSAVLEGGAAENAGLFKGDRILAVYVIILIVWYLKYFKETTNYSRKMKNISAMI